MNTIDKNRQSSFGKVLGAWLGCAVLFTGLALPAYGQNEDTCPPGPGSVIIPKADEGCHSNSKVNLGSQAGFVGQAAASAQYTVTTDPVAARPGVTNVEGTLSVTNGVDYITLTADHAVLGGRGTNLPLSNVPGNGAGVAGKPGTMLYPTVDIAMIATQMVVDVEGTPGGAGATSTITLTATSPNLGVPGAVIQLTKPAVETRATVDEIQGNLVTGVLVDGQNAQATGSYSVALGNNARAGDVHGQLPQAAASAQYTVTTDPVAARPGVTNVEGTLSVTNGVDYITLTADHAVLGGRGTNLPLSNIPGNGAGVAGKPGTMLYPTVDIAMIATQMVVDVEGTPGGAGATSTITLTATSPNLGVPGAVIQLTKPAVETRAEKEEVVGRAAVIVNRATAVGANSTVTGHNGVAIGFEATAAENGIVIGTADQTAVIGGVDLAGIATNTGNITTNTGNITTNTGNITTNTAGIATNTGNITTNTAGIATNKNAIDTNRSGIAMSVALAHLPTIKGGGWGIAAGTFDSETAIAVGAHFGVQQNAFIKVGAASSGGETSFGIGYGKGF